MQQKSKQKCDRPNLSKIIELNQEMKKNERRADYKKKLKF